VDRANALNLEGALDSIFTTRKSSYEFMNCEFEDMKSILTLTLLGGSATGTQIKYNRCLSKGDEANGEAGDFSSSLLLLCCLG
jgi:hypothetical protein